MFAEECHCRCHTSNNVKHIIACCMSCPVCTKNIKPFSYKKHVEECEKDYKELLEKAKKVLEE